MSAGQIGQPRKGFMMRFRFCVVALAAIAALLSTASPAGAGVSKAAVVNGERHCVAYVVDDAEAATRSDRSSSLDVCFKTVNEVDAYLGNGTQRSSSNVIGRHFSNTSYGGSSITIVGTTCGGGVWYATGSWNNNIESTYNYCGTAGTRFYDASSCSGASRFTSSGLPSLSWMNNRTSCVRYG